MNPPKIDMGEKSHGYSPRVRVLVPAYNRANYLPETIARAQHQTFNDIEIIVVDDGLTGDIVRVVRAIADLRVRYLHQNNRSVSVALNTAWRAARDGAQYCLSEHDNLAELPR